MYSFDTSAIIDAWDIYPIEQFPPFWHWMAEQITDEEIAISSIAFDELTNKSKECKKWLKIKGIKKIPMSNDILTSASQMKLALEITDDNYHVDGVGENDLFIVATAQCHKLHLVSNEANQAKLPKDMRKYKIPAVCRISAVNVPCMSLLEYIKNSAAIFG